MRVAGWGRAALSRLPSTADPVYCKEQPDLWGIKLDEQEKHKSVQKLLSERLLYADPSAGLDRHGQRRAAEEAPGKPKGLVPSGDAAGPRMGKEPEPQPSPSTPLLPLAASSSSSKAHPRKGSGATWFWYQTFCVQTLTASSWLDAFCQRLPQKGKRNGDFNCPLKK